MGTGPLVTEGTIPLPDDIAIPITATAAKPNATAAPPVEKYKCPICGETFATYYQLYSHFTTEHPATPIEIIWE